MFFFLTHWPTKKQLWGVASLTGKKTSRVFQLNVCGGETSVGRQALTKENQLIEQKSPRIAKSSIFCFLNKRFCFLLEVPCFFAKKGGVLLGFGTMTLQLGRSGTSWITLAMKSRRSLSWRFPGGSGKLRQNETFFCWRRCPIISNVRYKLYYIILYCIIFYLYHIIILY